MKVYIVLFQDWDINEILSIFSEEEAAETYVAEYKKSDPGYSTFLSIEEHEVIGK